tara:strand:+ start:433 stop:783 length:351 start_codon:yes stop_codon:yes gene_type:complete
MDTGPAAWLYMMENKNYAISHRHKFNEYYEDYFGKHTQVILSYIAFSQEGTSLRCTYRSGSVQEVGVTSLYLLDYNGTQLLFADPWLHPKWNRPLEGPKRGTVRNCALPVMSTKSF